MVARPSKQQIIEAIQQTNRSAAADFLFHFDETALSRYLERLTNLHGRRGPGSIWVRQGETPAIVTRRF